MSSENYWSAGADSVGPAMQGAQSWSRQACEEVGRLAGHEWALLRVALRTGGGTGLPVEPEGGPRTLCFSALPPPVGAGFPNRSQLGSGFSSSPRKVGDRMAA